MTALASITGPAGHDVDDADLVARVRAGDDRAFEALFLRYQPRIAAWVRSRVHDHGRAEDITQEVFLSAVRRLRETDGEIAIKPWLYEIARNACTDAWRRSRHTNEISFDEHEALGADDHGRLTQPALTPDSAVDVKLAFDNLRGALDGLSPSHHELVVLREFEGRSYREIGDRLGMSRASVESALFRARRQLTEEYEELVSGNRCRTVQAIIDTHGGRGLGVRNERRITKHVAHCQPCRRYAWLAGVEFDLTARPSVAARIAALLPWPLLGRRRGSGDAGQLAAPPQSAPLANAAQWSSTVATALDPAAASGLSKLLATAATVAVASLGAGAAIHEREAIKDLLRGGQAPAAAERSDAAARQDTAARGTSSAGAAAGAGPLASDPTVGVGPAASGESTAPAGRQPADARTPSASDAAGGGRASSTTGSPPSRQGTADGTAPTGGGLPLAPPRPLTSAVAPSADGATAGGGAATAPSAPIPRPQTPSAPSASSPPSADDLAGQAGSVTSGAPSVQSPSTAGVPPETAPTPAPPKAAPASPPVTDTPATAMAGRLAP